MLHNIIKQSIICKSNVLIYYTLIKQKLYLIRYTVMLLLHLRHTHLIFT